MSKFSISPDLLLLNACRSAHLQQVYDCDPLFLERAVLSGGLISQSCAEIAIPRGSKDPGYLPGWRKFVEPSTDGRIEHIGWIWYRFKGKGAQDESAYFKRMD